MRPKRQTPLPQHQLQSPTTLLSKHLATAIIRTPCQLPLLLLFSAVEQLTIQPIKTISGTVKLPGSKSLSNRILLLAALAEGTTVVRNLLVSSQQQQLLLRSSKDQPVLLTSSQQAHQAGR